MQTVGNRWSLVLAAGDGTRLRRLTTDRDGVTTPKQFCSLRGDGSLLRMAIRRAGRVSPVRRLVAVVAADHERWWRRDLADLPPENIVVQPSNRGTAPGMLLPLLEITARDPAALVLVLPSDHYVRDEATLERTARRALAAVERGRAGVVLLGIEPDAAVSDYGWVVPARERARGGIRRVAAFVEKPPRAEAERLMRRGGMWNSFVIAARAGDLLALFGRRLPWLTLAFREAMAADPPARARTLACLYQAIEPADFSRDVLAGSERSLNLLGVPRCGWTDLGTPERVASCLEGMSVPRAGVVAARGATAVAPSELLWSGMVLLSGGV